MAFDLLGWEGYSYITFFILALSAGLVYVWKKGGLEWGPKGRRGLE
ncbi:MAG TPA: NADH-quinone oxidoreductase subunit A [Nitrospirota bacterium]|nr:NADH-quinone oxidoreductase subunit A [Nitrospirota bacterium]